MLKLAGLLDIKYKYKYLPLWNKLIQPPSKYLRPFFMLDFIQLWLISKLNRMPLFYRHTPFCCHVTRKWAGHPKNPKHWRHTKTWIASNCIRSTTFIWSRLNCVIVLSHAFKFELLSIKKITIIGHQYQKLDDFKISISRERTLL